MAYLRVGDLRGFPESLDHYKLQMTSGIISNEWLIDPAADTLALRCASDHGIKVKDDIARLSDIRKINEEFDFLVLMYFDEAICNRLEFDHANQSIFFDLNTDEDMLIEDLAIDQFDEMILEVGYDYDPLTLTSLHQFYINNKHFLVNPKRWRDMGEVWREENLSYKFKPAISS